MLTRCPRCSTTFRVTPEQLKARHGRVRCGHCNDVFNALDTLIEATPQPAPIRAEEVVEEAVADEPVSLEPTGKELHETSAPATEKEVGLPTREEPEATANKEAEPAQAPSASKPELPAREMAATPAREVALTPSAPLLEPLLHEPRTWAWALGSIAAMLVLLMQAAVHYRTEISVLYPAAKPMLSSVCAPLGCEVPLPRKPELVGIEASSLAPETGSKLALSATLKNRAPFVQQYPDMELTLTDTADKALVRRVLAPADYLPAKTDVGAGFAAGGETAINLSLDAGGLPAAGYQLYLFYP